MENQERHISVWNNCLRVFENLVEPAQFKTWFLPIKPISLIDSTLTVAVPSDFFREYLEDAYLDVIKKTLKREIGADARLVYVNIPVKGQPSMTYPASTGHAPVNNPIQIATCQPSGTPNPFVIPGVQKIQINPRLNPVFCFSNIVGGACNKMAVAAGQSIAAAPGKTPYNPLFIFGGPGLGKTHIAQAIGVAIKEKFQDLTVLYVTGNEFKTQYMDAVMVRNKLTDFLAYYMKIDVLIVDDIQDMAGQGSQAAFFNVFNHLHQNGKQLVFTSDRAPVDLQNFEERLLSRFKWGLSVELERPDYKTRLEALKARCFREGVTLPLDALEYLAANIKTNFRELEGALITLIAHTTMSRDASPLALARHLAEKLVSEPRREISIDRVQRAVCEYFNISRDEMISKSRRRQIVQARQISMYLSRNLLSNCSLATIGAETGGRDHATVLYACGAVSDLISTDRLIKKYVSDIESILSPA